MSSTTSDPTKYWRGGVAIKVERKKIMDERLQQLGMKTIGDLATFFITADGVVEALKPVADKYNATQRETPAQRVKELAKQLQDFSPEELERLMKLAKQQEAA